MDNINEDKDNDGGGSHDDTTTTNNNNTNTNFPNSILFTDRGRNATGISSIGRITETTYKVFSTEELSPDLIQHVFGTQAIMEYVKVWGEGATPAFHMNDEDTIGGPTPTTIPAAAPSYATQFLLYDGSSSSSSSSGTGTRARTTQGGPAIYYTNAMESAVSAIEISAMG